MPTGGKSTLTQFLIEERRRAPQATGDLNALITDVSLACKAISRKVAYGGLAGALSPVASAAPQVNVQGEEQKAIDVLRGTNFAVVSTPTAGSPTPAGTPTRTRG